MVEEFIISKLNEIGRAIKRNALECIILHSEIDNNFGRLYIRWFVDIFCDDGGETHYYKDYHSYRFIQKNFYFYRYDEKKELIKDYKEVMTSYYMDIERFVELVSAYYPEAKLINFITNFEVFDTKLEYSHGRDISYLKRSDCFDNEPEYVKGGCQVLIKNRFEYTTLEYYGDKINDNDKDNVEIMHHIEGNERCFKHLTDMKKRLGVKDCDDYFFNSRLY